MLVDKFNLELVLKFKEEGGQFIGAGYVPNHQAVFYKIVLNANESMKLERTLKMLEEGGQFIGAGYVLNQPAVFYKIVLNVNESMKLERNLKMLGFIECGEGDPEMATLVGDHLEDLFKLLPNELLEHIFDLLNIEGIDSISKTDPKLSTLVQEIGLYKKKIVLKANESMKLESTLKMLVYVECGERDLKMATLVGDNLEEFFKLGMLSFKKEEPYFKLFTLANKLNLELALKFKEEAVHFVVVGYVPNHRTAFYKIVLNTNESMKLERTLKMLACVDCGEKDPELATLVGDYLEDVFKLVRDKLLFPLYIEICKVGGLLSLGV
ncbi:hypothetical protein POTOM_017676 [Populus tomentosa]|uniref:F-box domain-containing protein n=1 Tax=Populus tomentosa TaxID=118781 RepID=A0A8X7ZVC3_POPTO|nr:hypothetical protein POTOM_017676 [Populus tomentosa]